MVSNFEKSIFSGKPGKRTRAPISGAEHGAQLLRPHPLRHLLAGEPPAEAEHEGEHADVAADRHRDVDARGRAQLRDEPDPEAAGRHRVPGKPGGELN